MAREAIADGYDSCAVTSVPAADVEGAVLDHVQKLLAAPERNLARVAGGIQWIATQAIERLFTGSMEWRDGRLSLGENPKGTIFGLYRGFFWDFARQRLADKEREQGATFARRSGS